MAVVRENYLAAKCFWTKIILKYDNVSGALIGGSCSDFKITDNQTEYNIHEFRITNNTIVLITEIPYFFINDLTSIKLSYLPTNSNAAIHDSNYQSISELINFPIHTPINISPYLNTIYISQLYYSLENMNELELKSYQAEISFFKRVCSDNIFVVSDVYNEEDADGKVVFFMFKYNCLENMNLNLHLGHSGPIKVWANQKEAFSKNTKRYLIDVDDTVINIPGNEGTNEIIIAMKINYKGLYKSMERYVGILVRMERVSNDLTAMLPFILN